ncbi:hypothetical protein LCGC14_1399860 [marine sediment metagenome]|uniref:HNH domain-containing protein n=1 Tax=marine sediment metagenome TaxID=412755 RepID=A0A0F9MCZ2_9ZZZZ
MASYFEKLKDPRWQKKRLEVLQAANFECTQCGDSESTLHVHHLVYRRGRDPWEYPAKALVCLCEDCHEKVEGFRERLLLAIGVDSMLFGYLTGFAKAWWLGQEGHGGREEFCGVDELFGACIQWNINSNIVPEILLPLPEGWQKDDIGEEGPSYLVTWDGFRNLQHRADAHDDLQQEGADAYDEVTQPDSPESWIDQGCFGSGYEHTGWWIR